MKKRTRRSRYDQYAQAIKHLIDAGATYEQVAYELEDMGMNNPCIQSIGEYCRKHGIRSRITCGARNGRIFIPRCEDCESMTLIKNTVDQDVRVCMRMKRIVQRSCTTSPMMCPRRGERSDIERKEGNEDIFINQRHKEIS